MARSYTAVSPGPRPGVALTPERSPQRSAGGLLTGGEPAHCPVWSEECYQRGFWGDRLLFDDVVAQADRRPSKIAVADERGTYRYDELVVATMSVIAGLGQLGVESGDVVVVAMPPMREFVPILLAVERLGAVVANVLPTLGEHELGRILKLASPRAVFTADAHRSHSPAKTLHEVMLASHEPRSLVIVGDEPLGPRVATKDSLRVVGYADLVARMGTALRRELPDPPTPDQLANLAFTTGSTSEPKGVLHTHNTSLRAVRSTAACQELGEDDVFHAVLPVGHTFGYFYGVRLGLAVGGQVVMQRTWDPEEMLKLAEKWRITHSAGTPTHLADVLGSETALVPALASLRVFTCAGATLDARLAEEALDRLPGRLSVAYGMSEAGHVASTGPAAEARKVLETCGRPHPETTLWVDMTASQDGGASGEVVIRGPSVFAGYLEHLDPSVRVRQRDGVYRTGDFGFLDDDGYLVLTGRRAELVVRGGEKIPVGSLERMLRGHPGINEVVITGVPDLRLGERCVAVIEARGASDVGLEDVLHFLARQGVTRAFWPEAVVSVRRLPRNEVGKWVRNDVRQLACERLGVGSESTRGHAASSEGEEST